MYLWFTSRKSRTRVSFARTPSSDRSHTSTITCVRFMEETLWPWHWRHQSPQHHRVIFNSVIMLIFSSMKFWSDTSYFPLTFDTKLNLLYWTKIFFFFRYLHKNSSRHIRSWTLARVEPYIICCVPRSGMWSRRRSLRLTCTPHAINLECSSGRGSCSGHS